MVVNVPARELFVAVLTLELVYIAVCQIVSSV